MATSTLGAQRDQSTGYPGAISGRERALRAALAALPYAAVVAVVVAAGLPTLILPFWSDSAIFATVGKAISDGGFPYVDAWDQKPPAIYLIFAVAIHGPFQFMQNVRVFDLVWTSATAVVITELGRRWWNLRAGMIAAIAYGVTYMAGSGWWQLAQPDGFIGLPILLALLLQDIARGRRGLLIVAGLLLGFAFQLRFIMALLIPFLPLVEVTSAPRGSRFRVWFTHMLWFGVGFALFQGAMALYLAIGGALDDYLAATRFATGYTRLGGPWQSSEGPTLYDYLQAVRLSFLFWALTRLVLTAPAIIGGFYGAFIARDRRIQQLVLFCALAYLGIATQAKFFWYHYQYMLPFLGLIGGWTWDRTYRRLREVQPRPIAVGVTGLLAVLLLLSTPEVLDSGKNQWTSYIRWHTRPQERDQFLGYFGGHLGTRDVADYVRTRTQPGEYVYVWGYDPLVYLMGDRPSSSRFIYSFPMMSDWAPRSWQPEFMEELVAHPPAYFVAQRNQGGPWIVGHDLDPVEYIDWFPALRQWLDANYEFELEAWSNLIYRRKDRAPIPPCGACGVPAPGSS
jgi:hypothetical protein